MGVPTEYSSEQDLYILKHAGVKSYGVIGDHIGRTRHQIRGRHLWLRTEFLRFVERLHAEAGLKKDVDTGLHLSREATDTTETVTCVDPDIKTVEELIEHCKVDLTVWRVSRSKVNRWGGFARTRSYKHAKNDYRRQLSKIALWQVTIHLERIDDETKATQQLRADLISELSQYSPKYNRITKLKNSIESNDALLAEVSIPDHHFGKLSWAAETGGRNYDLKIATALFRESVAAHADKLRHMDVDQILFPIGNDLFHADNDKNETTAGTPQDCDGRWQKSWMSAKQAITDGIDLLREIAPVKVIVVPGNHDRMKSWLFGDMIDTHYRLDEQVTVDNAPNFRKFIEWGQVLLGFTHGSDEPIASLPGIMASTQKEAWGRTSHREWHLGHLHTRREWRYNAGDVVHGVGIRILPSMCDIDAWHAMKGYVTGPRASEMYLWRKHTGFAGLLVHSPRLVHGGRPVK